MKNINTKLKEVRVMFGIRDRYDLHILNPGMKSWEKYNPELTNFINYICETVDQDEDRKDTPFDLWLDIYVKQGKTEVYVTMAYDIDMELFKLSFDVEGEIPEDVGAFEVFLSRMNNWLNKKK